MKRLKEDKDIIKAISWPSFPRAAYMTAKTIVLAAAGAGAIHGLNLLCEWVVKTVNSIL